MIEKKDFLDSNFYENFPKYNPIFSNKALLGLHLPFSQFVTVFTSTSSILATSFWYNPISKRFFFNFSPIVLGRTG